MSTHYLGQIETFAFDFAPRNWLSCAGQLLPIQQFTALFSLLGTTYGGNGTTNFGLPNLQSRVAIGSGQPPGGSNYVLGQTAGEEAHTLLHGEMAMHSHVLNADANTPATSNTNVPASNVVLGQGIGVPAQGANFAVNMYTLTSGTPSGSLDTRTVAIGGGGQPHANVMPYLALTFCIATTGIFPSRN
jgi:microcystin-dependent protein